MVAATAVMASQNSSVLVGVTQFHTAPGSKTRVQKIDSMITMVIGRSVTVSCLVRRNEAANSGAAHTCAN